MSQVPEQRRQTNIWLMFAIQGSFGSLVGIAFLAELGATVGEVMSVVGFYWFVTGGIALARFFIDRSHPWIWSIFTGIAGILTGFLMVKYPLLAALTAPSMAVVIFGALGSVMGLLGIIDGVMGDRIGTIIVGVANAVVAMLLFSSSITPPLVLRIVLGVVLIAQNVALGIRAFGIGGPRQVSSDI
jgi:uncharacterized membrane protein HdeD (DUF308 family)